MKCCASSGKCIFTNLGEERRVPRITWGAWGSSRRSHSPVAIVRPSRDSPANAAHIRNITTLGMFLSERMLIRFWVTFVFHDVTLVRTKKQTEV